MGNDRYAKLAGFALRIYAGANRDTGFAGGARNPERGGAAAGGECLLQPIAAKYPAAMRSDGAVRDGAGGASGEVCAAAGPANRLALQHVRAPGTAARADRKSRRSIASRRASAHEHGLPVF